MTAFAIPRMHAVASLLCLAAGSPLHPLSAQDQPATDTLRPYPRDTVLTGIQDFRNGTGPFFYRPGNGINGGAAGADHTGFASRTFRFGDDAYSVYETRPPQWPDSLAWRLFSRMRYYTGAGKEQDFTIRHRQPLSRSFAFHLLFRTMNTTGYYRNQTASLRNFNTGVQFRNPARTWRIRAGYLSNRLTADENGGLEDDAQFEAGGFSARTLEMRLGEASSERGNRRFFVDQQVALRRHTPPDSLDRRRPALLLVQSAAYEIGRRHFRADRFYPEVFPAVYFDSTATHDSSRVRDLTAALGLRLEDLAAGTDASWDAWLTGTFQRFDCLQLGVDTLLDDWGFESGVALHLPDGTGARLTGSAGRLNAGAGRYRLGLEAEKQLADSLPVFVRAEYGRETPDFIFSWYRSNHFLWRDDPGTTGLAAVTAGGTLEAGKHRISLEASGRMLKDYVYFDENALPARHDGTIRLLEAGLSWAFSFGSFRTENKVTWRQASPAKPLRVSPLTWYGTVVLNTRLFKRALASQFGIAVRYAAPYFADAYEPATARFYEQHATKTGGYPFVDLFANFRIKAARFFMKIEHFNAGMSGYSYFVTPHYPFPGRTIRFGVIWDFWD